MYNDSIYTTIPNIWTACLGGINQNGKIEYIYYTSLNKQMRTDKLWCHRLSDKDNSKDICIYTERDPYYYIGIKPAYDCKTVIMSISSKTSTQNNILFPSDPFSVYRYNPKIPFYESFLVQNKDILINVHNSSSLSNNYTISYQYINSITKELTPSKTLYIQDDTVRVVNFNIKNDRLILFQDNHGYPQITILRLPPSTYSNNAINAINNNNSCSINDNNVLFSYCFPYYGHIEVSSESDNPFSTVQFSILNELSCGNAYAVDINTYTIQQLFDGNIKSIQEYTQDYVYVPQSHASLNSEIDNNLYNELNNYIEIKKKENITNNISVNNKDSISKTICLENNNMKLVKLNNNNNKSLDDNAYHELVSSDISIDPLNNKEIYIPMSITYNKYLNTENSPSLVLVYGAYGMNNNPQFCNLYYYLMSIGFKLIHIHTRGGKENGNHWYFSGRNIYKYNGVRDIYSSLDYLYTNHIIDPLKTVMMSDSAGAVLSGIFLNEYPTWLAGAIFHVPLLDLIEGTKEDIPLGMHERHEWGDPNIPIYNKFMNRINPFKNLKQQSYPPVFITTGLYDRRVPYYIPIPYYIYMKYIYKNPSTYLYAFSGNHFCDSDKEIDVEKRLFQFILNIVNNV
ncbi:hypothetical protein WA158_002830 [Blastocystis sp. Blastoise]